MSKGKYKTKKSSVQAHTYSQFISKGNNNSNPTVESFNSVNLTGSDEIVYNKQMFEESNQKPVPKPLKYGIKDFIKNNIIQSIIAAVLAAAIIGICTFINVIKSDCRIINYRLDNIQKSIENIEINYSTKEIIELQLDNIRTEFNNKSSIEDLNNLSNELDILEKELESIKNTQSN